ERLVAALRAAQQAGGDIRGMQSAAILVVPAESTGDDWTDIRVDLRVEDHDNPVDELARLVTLHRAYDHMNRGDLAMEKMDVESALREYSTALQLAPDNSEMAFWTGVSLVNAGRLTDSLPYFRQAFADTESGADWRELLRRLPDSKLFPKDPALLQRVLDVH
ncbi:MAG: DUF1028 domain-containing protein, partial [Planctomycetota bacterium]|nr:DUF1028 domain-containing protein [Planctomycetota bacterium]